MVYLTCEDWVLNHDVLFWTAPSSINELELTEAHLSAEQKYKYCGVNWCSKNYICLSYQIKIAIEEMQKETKEKFFELQTAIMKLIHLHLSYYWIHGW